MLRASKMERPSDTIVAIDGQLSGDDVELVETCCDQALSTGKPVWLFLRDVSTVDQAGGALLSRLAAKGVRLRANGVYTSFLIQGLTRQPEVR